MTRTTLGAAVSTDTAWGGTALGTIASTTTYDASALGATLSTNRWPPWIAADFEAGANGNTIATGDTASNTAWDVISIGTDAALIYDNARAHDGSLSAKVSTGATSTTSSLRWNSLGAVTTHYTRAYYYFTANPGAATRIMRWDNNSGSLCGFVLLSTGGLLTVADSTSAAKGTTTNAISLNQWVRIEVKMICSATVGQMEIKLFNTPDSTTPTETVTSAANLNTLTETSRARFGVGANAANIGPFWMDDLAAGYTVGYPGPSA